MDTNYKELNIKICSIITEVKAMLRAKEKASETWEVKCYHAEMEVITCEDLIFFYDTPEMSARLTRAYNRLRHYQYIYYKINDECKRLEKMLDNLKQAIYYN